jgi:hypothetical protein
MLSSLTTLAIVTAAVLLVNQPKGGSLLSPVPPVIREAAIASTVETGSWILAQGSEKAPSVSGQPLLADARPVVIHQYLERWNSPLVDYSNEIVTSADSNGIDPMLVVAIAQQESNLGKHVPDNCYNAWGWAITGAYTRCFDSWDSGIKQFTNEFAQKYIRQGLTTPEKIMVLYNHDSPDGSWARGVNQFLDELHHFSSS